MEIPVLLSPDVDIQKSISKQVQGGVSGGLSVCRDRLSLLLLSLDSSLSRVCQASIGARTHTGSEMTQKPLHSPGKR